jgi:hypothetical protein
MAANRGRRILFNQHDEDEEDEEEDDDEVVVDEEDEDDEQEREADQSSGDGNNPQARHSSEDDSDGDSNTDSGSDTEEAVNIRDWNDDELPELIRIDTLVQPDVDGSANDAPRCNGSSNGEVNSEGRELVIDYGNGNGNGCGDSHETNGGNVSSNGRHRSGYDTDEGDEDDGSPARKNPRCTTSPANRSFPIALSGTSQSMLMEVVDVDHAHMEHNSAGIESGGAHHACDRTHDRSSSMSSVDVAHMTISAAAEEPAIEAPPGHMSL